MSDEENKIKTKILNEYNSERIEELLNTFGENTSYEFATDEEITNHCKKYLKPNGKENEHEYLRNK